MNEPLGASHGLRLHPSLSCADDALTSHDHHHGDSDDYMKMMMMELLFSTTFSLSLTSSVFGFFLF
jgi:hypothetical protein